MVQNEGSLAAQGYPITWLGAIKPWYYTGPVVVRCVLVGERKVSLHRGGAELQGEPRDGSPG